MKKEKISKSMSELAKYRHTQRTEEEKKEHSKKMLEARKAKLGW